MKVKAEESQDKTRITNAKADPGSSRLVSFGITNRLKRRFRDALEYINKSHFDFVNNIYKNKNSCERISKEYACKYPKTKNGKKVKLFISVEFTTISS